MKQRVFNVVVRFWAVAILMISCRTMSALQAEDGIQSPKLSFEKHESGVKILVDGQLFTEYLYQSGARPVIWPIIGPTGQSMTRAYPVGDATEGEQKDHIHHRSMWIGYEGLNGNDYWHEEGKKRPYSLGTVEHCEIAELSTDGSSVKLATENAWLSNAGELVCTDTRTYRFCSDREKRWIDCLLELKASSGDLEIQDSKEGFIALRVASSMRVEAGLGGRIVTSAGKQDAEAWSSRADWLDYHGPINGETVGIAILYHPKSYRPQPRWHVRTYGLFAVNPFGELAFTDPNTDISKRPLRIKLPMNESLVFRVRVIFHRGDEKQADIADEFERFSKTRINEL